MAEATIVTIKEITLIMDGDEALALMAHLVYSPPNSNVSAIQQGHLVTIIHALERAGVKI